MQQNKQKIHFIGIGGIGMSALAELMQAQGHQVSGSDRVGNNNTERLQNLGVHLSTNHSNDNINGCDIVVYSSAISDENCEMKTAKQKGIPMIKRGQLLATLFNKEFGIAVAGTHGKTTTSSMIAHLLLHAGMDPTYAIGGILHQKGSPAYLGKSNYFVAESDESDGSFLLLNPKIAVVTNIDEDHLENYEGDFKKLTSAFLQFIHNIDEDGLAIICIDNPIIKSLIPQIKRPFITYGFDETADYQAKNFSAKGLVSWFDCQRNDYLTEVCLSLPGRHNVSNATAVIALAEYLNIDEDVWLDALAHFGGVGRRFEYHGKYSLPEGCAEIYEDYGHHPNEIKATISAAQLAWPHSRLVLVFQPHRYTRTRDLMQEFADVLSEVDELILLEIYSAGEAEIQGVSSKALHQLIMQKGKVKPKLILDDKQLDDALQTLLQDNDIVIFQGAGSIGQMAKLVVNGSHAKN